MTQKKNRLQDFFAEAESMLSNASSDQTILSAISSYGYSSQRISEGLALYRAANDLHRSQQKEFAEQLAATDAFNGAWDQADKAYNQALRIARVAFKSHVNAASRLQLQGERNRSFAGWLEQVEAFYSGLSADPALSASMANFGYPAAKIAAEYQAVKAVKELRHQQLKETGEAQHATEQRDKSLVQLDAWLADFRAVSKVALADQSQQLEKLGMLARR